MQNQGTDHQEAQGHCIFQMSSSRWCNVIHATKKIYSIINFKEFKCNLYTMDYIYKSTIHCSKENLKCVLKCTKFPEKKGNGYRSRTNLVLILTNKSRRKIHIPIFDSNRLNE